jgi:hypothetical protein
VEEIGAVRKGQRRAGVDPGPPPDQSHPQSHVPWTTAAAGEVNPHGSFAGSRNRGRSAYARVRRQAPTCPLCFF